MIILIDAAAIIVATTDSSLLVVAKMEEQYENSAVAALDADAAAAVAILSWKCSTKIQKKSWFYCFFGGFWRFLVKKPWLLTMVINKW